MRGLMIMRCPRLREIILKRCMVKNKQLINLYISHNMYVWFFSLLVIGLCNLWKFSNPTFFTLIPVKYLILWGHAEPHTYENCRKLRDWAKKSGNMIPYIVKDISISAAFRFWDNYQVAFCFVGFLLLLGMLCIVVIIRKKSKRQSQPRGKYNLLWLQTTSLLILLRIRRNPWWGRRGILLNT